MAFSDNAKKIVTFLRDNAVADVTAADIAEALDLTKPTVNGCATGLQKKGLVVRVPAILDDGTEVKFIQLTDAGEVVDLDAE